MFTLIGPKLNLSLILAHICAKNANSFFKEIYVGVKDLST